MNSIQNYINFNRENLVEFSAIKLKDKTIGGLCTYSEENYSSFFIKQPTVTHVVKGEKYMMVNGTEYQLSESQTLFIPANSIVFTYINPINNPFISLRTIS